MKIRIVLFLFLFSSISFSQTAALKVEVTDFAFKPLQGEQVIFINQATKASIKGISDAKGIFTVNLPAGKYDIKIQSVGDAEDFSTFEVPALPPGQAYRDAAMQIQIEEPKFFTLDNLQFASGKWEILKTSYVELTELIEYLKLKPSIKIEIAGHTDDQGEEGDNLVLSQKRADAVKQFLVGKGIDAARIKTVGYGESIPIADNSTSTGKAKNRRTEIKIL